MKEIIKVGIIGVGGTISSTTVILNGEPNVKLVALADMDANRRKRVLGDIKGVQVFDDYQQMFDKCDLDAVCIGLPTWMHAPVSQEAVERGMHVLCEKPPSNDATELIPVTQLAASKGLTYMFVRQSRFSARIMEGRRLIQAGELGEVYYAETRWIRTRWSSARGWRHDKEKGGGVLLDLGIHAIDNVWFMMGCPRPTEAMAGLYCNFSHLVPPDQTYTADDAACGFVRFENGCTLHFAVAFSLNTTNRHNPSEESNLVRSEIQEFHLYGTKAGIENGKLLVGTPDGVKVKPMKPSPQKADDITLQAQEFIRAIREKDEPLNSGSQAVMLMQMLDAAMKSSEIGSAVSIQPIA
ncbi:Gfo/Idh/MocA family oxidoreductase [Candidatus Poribacteria bacterium]|nr:Gfo/Idh/MocA family oxidoreductase [Candidatus Poribacteria bacterium]